MARPAIYKTEMDDGLATVLANNVVTFASVVRPSTQFAVPEKVAAHLLGAARASQSDFDLAYIDTILVSTVWNRNDDVFDPLETWVARKSPEDKQLNYNHDDAKIVGHIISNRAIATDGAEISDDSAVDALPAHFHIVTGAVLYKNWKTPALQEQMDTILADIAKGEIFVSMECLFFAFDYALRGSDGITRIVARNSETAYLTKHLRAYGGTGKYGDQAVGRVLRNITFSGKGLVKNPANPESVILQSTTSSNNFTGSAESRVYSHVETVTQESTGTMTITIESLQATIATLTAANETLKANQQEVVVNDLKAQLVNAEKNMTSANELLHAAQAALAASSEVATTLAATTKTEIEALTVKATVAEASLAEVKEELKTLYATQTKAARLNKVKTELKLDDVAAAEFVASIESLDEAAFNSQVAVVAKAMTPKVETPAKKVVDGVEVDVAGEAAAVETTVETTETSTETASAIATEDAEAGVNEVKQAIAAYFAETEAEVTK